MCGRYVSRTDAATERYWELRYPPPFFESYNVAPTTQVPIIREAGDAGREAVFMRWGLIPVWAKGLPQKYSTINATIERMQTAPAYRNAWRKGQRCLIPVNGFYEWQSVPGHAQKQPYYIQVTDPEYLVGDAQFALAGLWESSPRDDGEFVESCTIITMPANELMAKIHNPKQRMPAILTTGAYRDWLSGNAEQAENCILQCPSAAMDAHCVSTYVNSPKHNDLRCIEPLAA